MVEPWNLVNSLESAILSFRKGDVCKAKIESLERINSKYKVKGTYVLTEYVLFSGERTLERGSFEAILDEDYKIISIKIMPEKNAQE